jgi:hypothetical protein
MSDTQTKTDTNMSRLKTYKTFVFLCPGLVKRDTAADIENSIKNVFGNNDNPLEDLQVQIALHCKTVSNIISLHCKPVHKISK